MTKKRKIIIGCCLLSLLGTIICLFTPYGIRFQFALSERYDLKKTRLILSSIQLSQSREHPICAHYVDKAVGETLDYSFLVLDEWIAKNPDDYEALLKRATLYFFLHQYNLAVHDYTNALNAYKSSGHIVCGCTFSPSFVSNQIQKCNLLIEIESQQSPGDDDLKAAPQE